MTDTLLDLRPAAATSDASAAADEPRALRLMSYNIQTGIETRLYHHYVTRGWRHFLPDGTRLGNLDRISSVIGDFDMVGLQEVDGGSFRSGYINQAQYLAQAAAFPYWYSQTNRNLGRLAQHSNGLLSRLRPVEVREHKLPGMIPGRGALAMRFGGQGGSLTVILVHLALGQRTRLRQLEYVAELVASLEHVVVMGDFNCVSRSPEIDLLRTRTDLGEPIHDLPTFPSWRPQHNIDHILVSSRLRVRSAAVLDYPLSDHLPITMEIELPERLELAA